MTLYIHVFMCRSFLSVPAFSLALFLSVCLSVCMTIAKMIFRTTTRVLASTEISHMQERKSAESQGRKEKERKEKESSLIL